MQRPLRTLLCLLPLALAACETSVPPDQASAPPPPAPASTPAAQTEVATAPAPAAIEAQAPTPAPAPAVATPVSNNSLPPGITHEIPNLPAVGVVACDSYVEAVRTCLNDGHIVGRERVKVRSALAKQVKAWSEAGKQPDIEACVAARGEARAQLKQYGCSNI